MITVISKWPAAAGPWQAKGMTGALSGPQITWVLVLTAAEWLCDRDESLLSGP